MDCREVERTIGSHTALPPAVLAHVQNCSACRELIRFLTQRDPVPEPCAALLQDVEHRILLDLKPVKPIRPASQFAAGFAVTFVAIVALGAWRLTAYGWGAMSPLLSGVVLSALAVSAALLIGSLVSQMVPGSKYRIQPVLLPLFVLMALGGLFAAAFPHRVEPNWRAGWICLGCGLGFFAPAAIVFWLLLRRGAVLSAQVTGTTMGVLAGLTGTTVLEIHCPLQGAWHILAWHLGVPLTGALICLAVASLAARRYRSGGEG
jgi:Negative regulator of sigma F